MHLFITPTYALYSEIFLHLCGSPIVNILLHLVITFNRKNSDTTHGKCVWVIFCFRTIKKKIIILIYFLFACKIYFYYPGLYDAEFNVDFKTFV